MKDKVVGIKLDAERDRMVRDYAAMKTGGKITPTLRAAIDFFFVRIHIEERVRSEYVVHGAEFDESKIHAETFRLLALWDAEPPEKRGAFLEYAMRFYPLPIGRAR